MRRWVLAALGLGVACSALAQLSPTGSHYAGRATDTGHSRQAVGATGNYSAGIALDLPAARGDLPIPLSLQYRGHGLGAAGAGWDLPYSYIEQRRSFAKRRPVYKPAALPEPRQRTFLNLLGQQVELIAENDVWIARIGTRELRARQAGLSWYVYDGQGRTYTFVQPPQLARAGRWLLKTISAPGAGSVTLVYRLTTWPVSGNNSALQVDLERITYNTHPTQGCAKHEIALTYGHGSTTPLSLAVAGEVMLTRYRVLTLIDVYARANCQSAPQRLRRYNLQYLPDRDTQLPRLNAALLFGREGSAEATAPVTLGRFTYGAAATTNGNLQYRVSQTINVPPEDDGSMISGSVQDSSLSAPGGGERHAVWQNLIDLTGDGRPELALRKSGKLWMAENRPAANGSTRLGTPATVPLQDAVFQDGPLGLHSLRKGRFYYATENDDEITVTEYLNGAFLAANYNTVNVWRQQIDVNGDGRLDIIDAAAEPMRWVIYLNTPGGPNGVVWKRTSISVSNLAAELTSRKHEIVNGRVPLARRSTSADIKVAVCWRWNPDLGSNGNWEWRSDLWGEHCFGDFTRVQERGKEERTFAEWELSDLNGDGYPDFVFNATPTRFQLNRPDIRGQTGSFISGDVWVPYSPSLANSVRVAYNIVGVRFGDNEPSPFARSVVVNASGENFGVAAWVSEKRWHPQGIQDVSRQIAGFADVNGDGLIDRVAVSNVYPGIFIGTARAFSGAYLQLPGPLSLQVGNRERDCASGQSFESSATHGLRDLTGDGVPDYVGDGAVFIGTGAGFTPAISVSSQSPFVFSHQTESCDGKSSKTDGGLYDIDGDGQPEILRLTELGGQRAYVVAQLAPGDSPRTPEVGRLTSVMDEYGARTRIAYRSAKEDLHSSHQVPFPEIVVASTEIRGERGLGGSLAGSRFAYGRAQMHFDPLQDAFVFPGYGRFAEVLPTGGVRAEGFATVSDFWPMTANLWGEDADARWLRLQRTGRPRDTFSLRASAGADPWALLGVEESDARVIGVTRQEWAGRLMIPALTVSNARDCVDVTQPYDFAASSAASVLNPCISHGFTFGTVTKGWYGAAAPPSTSNVQSLTQVREVDDFGRALFVEYQGDLFRSDDDVCVETKFALPMHGMVRVLDAVTRRRTTDCHRRTIYSGESAIFDQLPAGRVSAGRLTSRSVERRATDNGALLNVVREFDASYDALGNLASIRTQRGADVRTLQFEYEPFGLRGTLTRLIATGIPTTETRVRLDSASLEPVAVIDANLNTSGTLFDGLGRPRRTTFQEGNGPPLITSTLDYQGFTGEDPLGRRIMARRFVRPVQEIELGSAAGHVSMHYYDELGRERRAEKLLGQDYGGISLVTANRSFDALGRLDHESDPFPSNADAASAYGTTLHYKRDGELDCAIRGPGRQPLVTATDAAAEIFPTCYQRYFSDHVDTTELRDASSLEVGSSQYGVIARQVSSAIGRVLQRSMARGQNNLDHATFAYDRLGQPKSMTRYLDPATPAGPVQTSWRPDSLGQLMEIHEPDVPMRENQFSDWGELEETRWTDAGVLRRIVQRYDALGRLREKFDSDNGSADPESRHEFDYDSGAASAEFSPTYLRGRLSRARSPAGTVEFSYDAFGNIAGRLFGDTQGGRYVERLYTRLDGQLEALQLRAPDNGFAVETAKYGYDSAQRLRHVSFSDAAVGRALFEAEAIDELGRLRAARYGQTRVKSEYAPGGRQLLKEAIIESPGGVRRVIFLRYDAVGRELSRREIRDGDTDGPKTNVSYDSLGRLVSTFESLGITQLSSWKFDYDPLGNLLRLGDVLGNRDASLSLQGTDRDRVCRVGYGSGGLGGTACNVSHDALGNVTAQATRTGQRQISYFPSGPVRTVAQNGAQARFRYDAFGEVQELDVQGAPAGLNRQDRRYGGRFERRALDSGGAPGTLLLRHIPGLDGARLSRRGATDHWVYEFAELRGSRFFTDQDGQFVQTVDYLPFGEAVSNGATAGSPPHSTRQWNDGDALEALGLSHQGARLYDPVIGRFLSRDPLLDQQGGSTTNAYAFPLNDPLNNADPSGLDGLEDLEPFEPVTPFGSAGGSGESQCANGPCSRPPRDTTPPPQVSKGTRGPAVSADVVTIKVVLAAAVAARKLSTGQASAKFRDFVRQQLYVSQLQLGGSGYCMCASKIIALKFAGVLGMNVDYKQVVVAEGGTIRDRKDPRRIHFKEKWIQNQTRDSRLNTEDLVTIAQNSAIGTGTTQRLTIDTLNARSADQLLKAGGVAIVGTRVIEHWMVAMHDPFANQFLLIDPMAEAPQKPIQAFGRSSPMASDSWGPVAYYLGVFTE